MKRAFCIFAASFKESVMSIPDNNFTTLKDWKFRQPPEYAHLPIDDNPDYTTPNAVKHAIFSKVPPQPLSKNVRLVCASEEALRDILDLDPVIANTEEFVGLISGQYLPDGSLPVSHKYGGYQFGYWAGQLGDGRAHILGEYLNRKGECWQPQLKGSGETPYSRFGDGRAVLRSSIREMVASEACHFLGIPTTRAAALVVSDDLAWRDAHYTGAARQERTAVVMRLAPCWYRIGSVEIVSIAKEVELLRKFCNFIIKEHFPVLTPGDEDCYIQWFSQVAHRNLDMVASWQGFGFTHGVLNTDNTSLLGLTIDYGPYGFLDHYYGNYTPNTSDDEGRYAFNRQPDILLWNIEKFAKALAPILTETQQRKIEEIRNTLGDYVKQKILQTYLSKIGLEEIKHGDQQLIDKLLDMMQQTGADFTATFRQLAEVDSSALGDLSNLETKWSLKKISSSPSWMSWVKAYNERLLESRVNDTERRQGMLKVNPIYVPRNWILQEAINDAQKNDFEKVRFLLKILCRPYKEDPEAERRGFSSQPPSWAYGLKLSCSS